MAPEQEKPLLITGIWAQEDPAFCGVRQRNSSTGALQTDPATSEPGTLISLRGLCKGWPVLNTKHAQRRGEVAACLLALSHDVHCFTHNSGPRAERYQPSQKPSKQKKKQTKTNKNPQNNKAFSTPGRVRTAPRQFPELFYCRCSGPIPAPPPR